MIFDVAVIGGGNAALCSALAARSDGARVALFERAPREWRAGNSKYTRNIRCAQTKAALMPDDAYSEHEFFEDLKRASEGEHINEELARLLTRRSTEAPRWMERHGVRWQPALRGSLQLARTNRFFLGGGKALLNHYYAVAERAGVRIAYESRAVGFRLSGGRCDRVVIRTNGREEDVQAGAFVVASGGFESDREWLEKYWGDAAENFVVRGCPFNDGGPVQALLEDGAQPEGAAGAFHGIAVDSRSPAFDGGIVTRVDSIPFGIVVNRNGVRFYDEGEDVWPKRYAKWGRLIAEQPAQKAFSIFDNKAVGRFIPPMFPSHSAQTLPQLARLLHLEPKSLVKTISEYNRATTKWSADAYDLSGLDGRSTEDLTPRKSNWALPLDVPPFHAYPLCPGITFTYYGLGVDGTARVMCDAGVPFENLFAAGEAMAGNVLRRGYIAGVGMTIGTVFGRIAGEEAARIASA